MENTLSGAILTAIGDIVAQAWLVIPAGLGIFGIIYGLGRTKKAAKVAAA